MAKKKPLKKKSNRATKRSRTVKVSAKTPKQSTTERQTAPPPTMPTKLPNAVNLFRHALLTLWQYRRLFGGITLSYTLLTLFFVRQFGGWINVSELKTNANEVFGAASNGLNVGFNIFQFMLDKNRNGSDVAGLYQILLFITISLAIIWALRQVHAGVVIKVKDTFYKGMYPLIQFTLVLIMFAIELLPLIISVYLYKVILINGLAVSVIENILWGVVFLALSLLSLYLVSSSIFALYIVTLPDMTPFKALRSARQLVKGRRWRIARKIVFLPVTLVVIAGVIMIPLIIVLAPVADLVFFILSMLSVPVIHSYFYTLYRELL